MYLPPSASKRRLKEAEEARRNRAEIVSAFSRGMVTRRELIRMGLVTAGGMLVLRNGLSPFARSAFASESVTGAPPSPLFGVQPFTQPLPRLEVLQRKPLSAFSPVPTEEANTAFNTAKGIGPVEGRPPGPYWAHQRWAEYYPRDLSSGLTNAAYEVSQRPCAPGTRFHPALPAQRADKVWTYNGTFPPKLFKARYGEPVLFRQYNALPADPADNGGFGRNEITTHLHNGHTPAESDGFAGAYFYPGQFYDYHYPNILAGHDTINPDGSDPRAGGPGDDGGIVRVPGDWRETLSTLWFHDHRFDFTSHNVYKGMAGMYNLYSAVDRGNEGIQDGVNLRLPSGTDLPWGNLDYDVNLVISDKAFDRDGQLFFDIFNFEGFLGDVMTVNGAYKPFFEVERRKYRFRILNAGVARFLKLALSDRSSFVQIANDGNLLVRPVPLNELDQLGIAERYDIVIDFSRYRAGEKVWLVNLAEHRDGRRPAKDLSVAEALSGDSDDPGVGKILEFRIARDPARPDASEVPATMIPLPDRGFVTRERRFEFGRSGGTDETPWTIKVDGGEGLGFDVNRISAAPTPGTAEVWHLVNGGGGWDHPVHIHFEEGQVLARDPGPVPPQEALARKDVYRLRPGGKVTLFMRFREFAGTYVEHCHNTTHEDHAMLLRWDINAQAPVAIPTPRPTPAGVAFDTPEVLPEAI